MLNVVGPGAASPWQAVRLGGRVPVPVLAPFWEAAARTVEIAGAAIAPHVIECMRHGRTGSGSRAIESLGLTDLRSTRARLERSGRSRGAAACCVMRRASPSLMRGLARVFEREGKAVRMAIDASGVRDAKMCREQEAVVFCAVSLPIPLSIGAPATVQSGAIR